MWPQSRYRGRQRVSSSGDEVPHIFTRKSRVQPKEILIISAKRLFQQYRSKADMFNAKGHVRFVPIADIVSDTPLNKNPPSVSPEGFPATYRID
jgi:hypothetical protein